MHVDTNSEVHGAAGVLPSQIDGRVAQRPCVRACRPNRTLVDTVFVSGPGRGPTMGLQCFFACV